MEVDCDIPQRYGRSSDAAGRGCSIPAVREAIRRAVREGLVESPFTISWTGKDVRMIDLESAAFYWGVDTDKKPKGVFIGTCQDAGGCCFAHIWRQDLSRSASLPCCLDNAKSKTDWRDYGKE